MSFPEMSTIFLFQALVCGGKNTLRSCIEFKQDVWQWQSHSTLREDRYFHSVVVMPAGTYILGGYSSRYTSEFLPTGSVLREWILKVREVKSEMIICFTLFEKWKMKWKSDSLLSRSEKWNENASRPRSRSEISREYSRPPNFLKIFEKFPKTKKEESFQIQTIFLPIFRFWVHGGATPIVDGIFLNAICWI